MKKLGSYILVNLTAHPVDFVDADPNSLDSREVDFTVDVFQTLNGKWVDETMEKDGLAFARRKFVLDLDADVKPILQELQPGQKYLLVVSLPVLQNYKAQIEDLARSLGLEVIVAGIIPATQRQVKPPVASSRMFSI